MIEDSI